MRSPESKRVLASISNDAVSLHNSFLAAHGSREESIRDSVIMDQIFDFDNVLKNTELYRKAFIRQKVMSQTTKLEIATKAPITSSSVPGKPSDLPVPIKNGLTVIPSNSPSSLEVPGNSFLGEGRPEAGIKLDSAVSDQELTLAPIHRTNLITILPNLTRDHPRFQQVKAGQGGRRNSVNSQTSDDSILPSDSVSRVSSVEDQESILARIRRTDHITNSPSLLSSLVWRQAKANQDERRNSIESRNTDDTVLPDDSASRRCSVDDSIGPAFPFSQRLDGGSSHHYRSSHTLRPANVQGLLQESQQLPLWPSSSLPSRDVSPRARIMSSPGYRHLAASENAAVESNYDDPSSSANFVPRIGSGLPNLLEVLERRTLKPYSLLDFWLYMRDIQQSLDYLDFWYVFSKHPSAGIMRNVIMC